MEMRKAFDIFLQSEVSGDLASKNGGVEQYRYECAYCGEEVRLAAVGSISMVPHFRHLSGNNDIKCEEYLGQFGAISSDPHSRKSKNERAEFYFDKNTYMFFMGLSLSDDEIEMYEQQSISFELQVSAQSKAFHILCINNKNFTSDEPTMIPLEFFSNNYFLSNTLNHVKRRYDLFRKSGTNTPTFFKIQGNDANFKAKLVRSDSLYTNVPYFVVFHSRNAPLQDCCMPIGINVEDTFHFKTMDRKFLGKILTIKTKDVDVESLMSSWGYRLETSEALTLLWPPAAIINGVTTIDSNCAFFFSSFTLEPYGNINVDADKVQKITNGVSKVTVDSRMKIYRKNVEIVIGKYRQHSASFDILPIAEKYESTYNVVEENTHFLFNLFGVTPLSKGQSISLTPDSLIKQYRLGYLLALVYPVRPNKTSSEQLLNDLLRHYNHMERFEVEVFDPLDLSEIAQQYIMHCIIGGLINSAAKRFIEEGRI